MNKYQNKINKYIHEVGWSLDMKTRNSKNDK